MICFFDSHTGRGGGQVVLARLLTAMADRAHTALMTVSPAPLVESADVDARVGPPSLDELRTVGPSVLVANSSRDLLPVLALALRARAVGARCATVALVHSRPATALRRLVAGAALRCYDAVVPVATHAYRGRNAVAMPYLALGLPEGVTEGDARGPVPLTRSVKVMARPDPVKGLDVVPGLFRALTQRGFTCEVALGESVDGDAAFEEGLRVALSPWLQEGPRDCTWFRPGDVVLIPSRDETVCLAAQEAVLRSAYVVAAPLPALRRLAAIAPSTVVAGSRSVADVVAAFCELEALAATDVVQRSQRALAVHIGEWCAVLELALRAMADEVPLAHEGAAR